ncbi:MAG: uroporphyrinogen-III synthase [Methanophagales archaeon]|nr:uroporphyrinogen-III synthase [Methanophagales archaeon]
MRKKIAAFRPENVLKRSKEKADRYGFDFFGFPVFELVERKEALKEIESVFNEGVDIIVFTSLNGVKKSFSICEGKFDLKEKLSDADIEICAIGPVTSSELEKHGVRVDFMPEEYSAKGLMKLIDERKSVKNKKIVFLRSAEGGQDILDFLRGKGASVKDIPVYKVEINDSEKELFSEFVTYNPDYVLFTSSLTFKTFSELARKFEMKEKIFEVLEHAKIAAIGDLTAETICEEGVKVDLVAGKSTFEDVLKEIKRGENH